MGALLKLLVTIPFVAVLLWLSFANREAITLTWSPLHEPIQLAVAVIVLCAVVAGFIWGALITWINYAPVRREKRMNKKMQAKLEKELVSVKAQSTAVSVPSPQTWNP